METLTLLSILEILSIAIFANWVTGWFQPIRYFRDIIVEWWTNFTIKGGWYGFQSFSKVLVCPKCFAFWFTLAYKQDFWLALIVSFVALLVKFIIDKIEYWYEY